MELEVTISLCVYRQAQHCQDNLALCRHLVCFNNSKILLPDGSQQVDFNQSQFQEFIIAGGELGLKYFYTELAVFLLVVYLLILIGNSMVCIVVLLESKLHTPMYIFLCSLSIADIAITTSVLPKMISVCLFNDIAISFSGCSLQMITYLAFQCNEGILLGLMAYDRYVAICNPLRYNEIITLRICFLLAAAAWMTGTLVPTPIVIMSSRLIYCENHIMFWFCDFPPVIELSCSDTSSLLFLALANAVMIISFPAFIIIWSYSKIIATVWKIKSTHGRKKAFSTCSSHLSIVILFYTAHLCVYISSLVRNVHPNVLILISIFNCFLTPIANPIIYSFRNNDLKTAIIKHFSIKRILT